MARNSNHTQNCLEAQGLELISHESWLTRATYTEGPFAERVVGILYIECNRRTLCLQLYLLARRYSAKVLLEYVDCPTNTEYNQKRPRQNMTFETAHFSERTLATYCLL